MKRRKVVRLLLTASMAMTALTGCGDGTGTTNGTGNSGNVS